MSSATAPSATAHRSDRLRQVGVTVAEALAILGTLVGVGVLGTAVETSSSGVFSSDATILTPAGPAFSIWTPIYLGLLGYTVWQWLPDQSTDPRHRAIGWIAALSMILNAAWLLVTQQGWVWVSVLVILGLWATLLAFMARLEREPSYGVAETLFVDVTFGLYLGWVTVASFANVAAALAGSGVQVEGGPVVTALALVALAAAVAIGWFYASRFGARWSIAAAMAWGLAWLAWGRLADQPSSTVVGLGAVAGAVAVLTAVGRRRRRLAV